MKNTSWQTCPKCDGSGRAFNPKPTGCHWFDIAVTLPTITGNLNTGLRLNDPMKDPCPVCNGKMIISTDNGKPPKN